MSAPTPAPIRVLHVISFVDDYPYLRWLEAALDPKRVEAAFVFLGPEVPHLMRHFATRGRQVFHLPYRSKAAVPFAIYRLQRLIRQQRPDLVHTHLLDAGLVGNIAAKLAGVSPRFYTRYHSTFHHEYYPHAVFYDRLLQYFATDVLAISQNVVSVLRTREHLPKNKLHPLTNGIPVEAFAGINPDRVTAVRHRHNLPDQRPVVGVASRMMKLKGLQYLIPAFVRFRKKHPAAVLVLAYARGPYRPEVEAMLSELPPEAYRLIDFCYDMPALYACFDLFAHVPINPEVEALGLVYLEALAAGVPSIFTLSGIAREFVRHRESAWVVPFASEEAITEALFTLWENEPLRVRVASAGRRAVCRYDMAEYAQKLTELYQWRVSSSSPSTA